MDTMSGLTIDKPFTRPFFNGSNTPWTAALEQQLRTQWAEGRTGLEIGLALGFSREAILAKARRLNLSKRQVITFWTPEREAEFALMWAGNVSRREMAAHFGVSKSAIMGKRQRMGLPGRASVRDPYTLSAQALEQRKALAKRQRFYPKQRKAIVEAVPEPSSEFRCELVGLELSQCRFPHGDGPFQFCGHPIHARSYCAAHYARCYSMVAA